jgi:hypothetical protein
VTRWRERRNASTISSHWRAAGRPRDLEAIAELEAIADELDR